jgi:predicted nucleic acid-binding Zn finger protein
MRSLEGGVKCLGEPKGSERSGGEIIDIDSILAFNASKIDRDRAEAVLSSGRLVLLWEDPRIYVFMGDHGDHVIVDSNYCSCEAFYFSILRGSPGCYHVRVLRVASGKTTMLKRVAASADVAWAIIYEALTTGFSPTLRRLLFARDQSHG